MMLENVKKIIFITLVLPVWIFSASPNDDVLYIVYVKEIMNSFIKQSEKEYKIECIGTGGGFAKNVREIGIKFIAYRKGTIEEARKMEVNMVEALLTQVNGHEKIRPYLDQYPFTAKNLDVSIAFHKNDGACYSDGSVVYVFLARNKIFYRSEDPKTGKLIRIMDESYEEALKIVNETHSNRKDL